MTTKAKAPKASVKKATKASGKPATVTAIKPTFTADDKQMLLNVLNLDNGVKHAIAYMKQDVGANMASVVKHLLAKGLLTADVIKLGSTKELAPLIKANLKDTDVFTNNKGIVVPHGKYATSRAICMIKAYNDRHNVSKDGTVNKTNSKGVTKQIKSVKPVFVQDIAVSTLDFYNAFFAQKKTA